MTADPTVRALRNLQRHVDKAVAEARMAYEFSPGSYAFYCLNACNAASQALAALPDHLEESGQP